MILKESKLTSADNSGFKKGLCINIPGNFKKRYAVMGDKVLLAVKKYKFKEKYKIHKKKLYFGLIIGVRRKTKRFDGTYIKFNKNKFLTFNLQGKYLGSRVYGVISKEVRHGRGKKHINQKIISYSKGTV